LIPTRFAMDFLAELGSPARPATMRGDARSPRPRWLSLRFAGTGAARSWPLLICFLASLPLVSLLPAPVAALTHDLTSDWSETQNPNGPWSLNSAPGILITTHWPDWCCSPAQPAWAASRCCVPGHVPAWMKVSSVGLPQEHGLSDAPLGAVIMHGSEASAAGVTWTASANAVVAVQGGVWLARTQYGRSMRWTLKLNGVPRSHGDVTAANPYSSSSPFLFRDGSGGPNAMRFTVIAGDIINLELTKTSSAAEFTGVIFRINVSPPELPGGRKNYVVATAHFVDDPQTTSNWVQLGTYEFDDTDYNVTANMWTWLQASRPNPERVPTGTTPSGSCTVACLPPDPPDPEMARECPVMTASGFMDSPTWTIYGTYDMRQTLLPPWRWYVHVSWNLGSFEEWWVESSSDDQYAILGFKNSSSTWATHGYGCGSNASLGERRSMTNVLAYASAYELEMVGVKWDTGYSPPVHSFEETFPSGPDSWVRCSQTTWVLTHYTQTGGTHERCCVEDCPHPVCDPDACPDPCLDNPLACRGTQHYIQQIPNSSDPDRRDTYWEWLTWHAVCWVQCCFSGTSHVFPMLQVIDDSNAFRGWVGVEASFQVGDTRIYSDDMFAVFHIHDLLDSSGVGEPVGPSGTAPSGLVLNTGQPNPFSGSTTITFTMQQSGRASLAIYDVTGRSVAQLLDQVMQAGHHRAVWDGRSKTGAKVADGVYYCELQCGASRLRRQVVLLK